MRYPTKVTEDFLASLALAGDLTISTSAHYTGPHAFRAIFLDSRYIGYKQGPDYFIYINTIDHIHA